MTQALKIVWESKSIVLKGLQSRPQVELNFWRMILLILHCFRTLTNLDNKKRSKKKSKKRCKKKIAETLMQLLNLKYLKMSQSKKVFRLRRWQMKTLLLLRKWFLQRITKASYWKPSSKNIILNTLESNTTKASSAVHKPFLNRR